MVVPASATGQVVRYRRPAHKANNASNARPPIVRCLRKAHRGHANNDGHRRPHHRHRITRSVHPVPVPIVLVHWGRCSAFAPPIGVHNILGFGSGHTGHWQGEIGCVACSSRPSAYSAITTKSNRAQGASDVPPYCMPRHGVCPRRCLQIERTV